MNDLKSIFQSFETGIRSAKAIKPKEYLKRVGLDYNQLRIGFNSGQFHHRESQENKDRYESLGMITKSTAGVNKEGLIAYTVFGRYSVVFPLLNKQNQIVNFFAIRFELDSPKEEYLNQKGIYPNYPHPLTKRLYIVCSVLDCASLLQSKALDQREGVIALHDGKLFPQHYKAIKSLIKLEEIIILKY